MEIYVKSECVLGNTHDDTESNANRHGTGEQLRLGRMLNNSGFPLRPVAPALLAYPKGKIKSGG